MSRKVVPIVFLVLASLLLILGVSLNAVVGRNRARIQEDLQKSLGRAVTFGELKVSFWGGPGVSAKDLRIAEDPRFAATPFIQTKELKMQLRWLPLLAGKLQIDRFVLDEPEIQIIKNETGALNIETLASREKKSPPPAEPRKKKGPGAPAFLITGVNVKNGSVDYIDRSSREPAEVRLRKVDLDVRGVGRTGTAKVNLTSSVLEGQGRNLSVDGQVGPWAPDRTWSQIPLDLQLRCDSLLLPRLTRAIPALRTPFVRHLDATGPLAIETKLLGTVARPRFTELNLTGPLFGATENNTTVKGELDFSQTGAWENGVIKAQIVIDPLALEQLKTIPFFRQTLPASLLFEGPVSVAAGAQGRLDDLKMHARIKAERSEILYGNWFKKAKGVPVDVELKIERQRDRFVFQESALAIHNSKLKFSGALEDVAEPRLTVEVSADGVNLAGWEKLLLPLSGYNVGGNLRWDLAVKKNLASEDGLEVRGSVDLQDVQVKDKKSGRGVERTTGRIVFRGRDARVEQLALRAGSSDVALEGAVPDLFRPSLHYTLRAAKLAPGDLMAAVVSKTDEMKSVTSTGELRIQDGKPVVRGTLSSPEGVLQEVPYRNLRGDVAWSPAAVGFKNLSFQALGGSLRLSGSWQTGAENSLRLALDPNIESMDVNALLSQKFPRFKDHIDGKLNVKAKLRAESKNISALPESLDGEGETQLRNGSLKDFNLMQLVFAKVPELPGMSKVRIPAGFIALAQRKDTPFDSLTATFTIKQGKIYSNDLLLSAPHFSVRAEGSVGLDKKMTWDATLVMSPQFTRELMQEYKNVRTMVDDQGRLAVPFHLEGTLPHVQAKPDLQKLTEPVEKGEQQKKIEAPSGAGETQPRKKNRRERAQKGL
jgi:uncharacterized protein YhdP